MSPRVAVDDLQAFLLGTWSVEREIRAAGRGVVGGFAGEGRFTPVAAPTPHLRYLETGEMWLDGHAGPASRALRYHVDGTRAEVCFDDGRPFHALELRDGADAASHPCGDDAYQGWFEVIDADTWRHEWRVVGPAKDHVIATVLRRRRG